MYNCKTINILFVKLLGGCDSRHWPENRHKPIYGLKKKKKKERNVTDAANGVLRISA